MIMKVFTPNNNLNYSMKDMSNVKVTKSLWAFKLSETDPLPCYDPI